MNRYLIAAFTMLTTIANAASLTPATKPADAMERPSIEVVFVLDTTSSMSGLIQAAKEKIWSIANTLAATKPAPAIKMGLVAYRDRGDDYITKRTELTDDLDAVYNDLMSLAAQGGNDEPESVNQALHEAVTAMKWSKDKKTYRVIFLVGDCVPHMDYSDDVKYPETCKRAATEGIAINTIQCGIHSNTEPVWMEIAKRAEGEYFRVEQSGSAILASTPFDSELAELSKKLDETRVFYGDAKARVEQAGKMAAASKIYKDASVSAQAQRCGFNSTQAGAANFAFQQELVNEWSQGKVKLNDVKEEQLPEDLKKMTAEQREKFIREKFEQRQDLQAKAKTLSEKRQAHIQQQMKQTTATRPSLESGIYNCVKNQAAKKGIAYKGGPTF
jgi:Mg-chelatase subunit ChlD